MQIQDKDITRNENCRPVFFINVDAEILNKTLANSSQQNRKRITYHNQVGFISGMQDYFNIKNKI